MVFFLYQNPSGPLHLISMTEYKKNCCSCSWLPLELSVQLCGGMDSPLVIKVYDYDSDGTNVSNFCENVK